MRPLKVAALAAVPVFTLALVATAAAPPTKAPMTVTTLRYRQLAREAAGRKFVAQLELGHAEIKTQRSRQDHGRIALLVRGNAASASEFTYANATVLSSQFEAKRAAYHIAEADMQEKSWKLQAEWARTNQEKPVELAKLNLDLRRARVKILEDLVADSAPFARDMATEFGRVRRLRTGGAVSAEEFEHLQLIAKEAADLVVAADLELIAARQHAKEAEEDLAEATPPPAAPAPKPDAPAPVAPAPKPR